MNIFKRIFGRRARAASTESPVTTPAGTAPPAPVPTVSSRAQRVLDELEHLASQSTHGFVELDVVEKYLRSPDPDVIKAVAHTRFARSTAIGIANALIDLLGDEYKDVAEASAHALWDSLTKKEDPKPSLKFIIRSLRTEAEIPAHMSSGAARRALDYLRQASPSNEARAQFDVARAEVYKE